MTEHIWATIGQISTAMWASTALCIAAIAILKPRTTTTLGDGEPEITSADRYLIMQRLIVPVPEQGEGYDFGCDQVDEKFARYLAETQPDSCWIVGGAVGLGGAGC